VFAALALSVCGPASGAAAADPEDVRTLDGYHGVGGPRAAPFYERELGRTVQRSGNLAHVWSRYGIASQPDGPPEQTGVNSITLFHDGERWWILGGSFDAAVH
jgi:hypothetical protein